VFSSLLLLYSRVVSGRVEGAAIVELLLTLLLRVRLKGRRELQLREGKPATWSALPVRSLLVLRGEFWVRTWALR
jgi:hypothetical protein